MLALQINKHNHVHHTNNNDSDNEEKHQKINLKGFIVANGVTNWNYDVWQALPDQSLFHNIIDDRMYNDLKSDCKDFNLNKLDKYQSDNNKTISKKQLSKCQETFEEFHKMFEYINPYNIYGKCNKYEDDMMMMMMNMYQL